ncbi:MAG: YheC/YheD family protein [Candidatus Gastranaerophilaceae bacterium]
MNSNTCKILFIIDKLELKYFEFNKLVTDFWLIKELLESGQDVFVTTIDKLGLNNARAYCRCAKSFVKGDNIYLHENFEKAQIESFQLVMFRPDPPVDLDYINATYILDFVDRKNTLILNDTKVIRDFNEKLHANLFNEFMPDNIVTSNQEEIENFLEKNKEIILKPLNRCFGSGVMFLRQGDKNTHSIINSMTNNQTALIMIQKYIPAAEFGDKRVLILGEEVLEECVVKLPSGDDFKFNTHSDEFIKKAALTDSERAKFKQVAQKLNSIGIYMAGLDVIDEQIIEINVTSPCYFIKEINNYFSTNLEKKITDYILRELSRLTPQYNFKQGV